MDGLRAVGEWQYAPPEIHAVSDAPVRGGWVEIQGANFGTIVQVRGARVSLHALPWASRVPSAARRTWL